MKPMKKHVKLLLFLNNAAFGFSTGLFSETTMARGVDARARLKLKLQRKPVPEIIYQLGDPGRLIGIVE